jgi:hypothetical protein
MVSEWTVVDWAVLVVDILAVVIVVAFLRRKIQLKLREVEARQAHERLMKKNAKSSASSETRQE